MVHDTDVEWAECSLGVFRVVQVLSSYLIKKPTCNTFTMEEIWTRSQLIKTWHKGLGRLELALVSHTFDSGSCELE